LVRAVHRRTGGARLVGELAGIQLTGRRLGRHAEADGTGAGDHSGFITRVTADSPAAAEGIAGAPATRSAPGPGGAPGGPAGWIVAENAEAGAALPDKPDRHERDQFVESSDLDESGRELLLRAQRAIGIVLGSGVHVDELLEQAAGEAVLRRHEWDIATALREIAGLRAELASSTAGGAVGPMTAAVLDSHRRALTLAHDATTSRISALEDYAAQVSAADAAQRDWRSAMTASGLNDKYLDLVARTAADEHAIAEITGLAG
jgi:hypothetical protein